MVLKQQSEFNRIWNNINKELIKRKVIITNERKLNLTQKIFVRNYFDEVVRPYIIPLMIEKLPELPYLRDKSLYLAIVMRNKQNAYHEKFALIEIPSKSIGRFVILPSAKGAKYIMLLEDIIKFNLPIIFSHFKFNQFDAHVFKITKDAEIDLDQEVGLNFVEKISKGVKNRRKGKPVRFVYDKDMNAELLDFLIQKLHLTRKSSIIPGGHIHNFRHFMDFPEVLVEKQERPKPFVHPAFRNKSQVSEVILKKDVMLHFPYHSFDPVIDMLREAAMDDNVLSIKITAYRLANNSKVINALINAARNGKEVTVFLELKARFDEEANLEWKNTLEEEGVKVILGIPNMKVHAKICVIKKRVKNKTIQYGFVSTGNLNEKTAQFYGDHCLLTSNRNIMADINKVFHYLENPSTNIKVLDACNTLLVSPTGMRKKINQMIDKEIKNIKKGLPASITLKLNSLSDIKLVEKLYQAKSLGVKVDLIIRGIYCAKKILKKKESEPHAISIVDEFLEHARVLIFHNGGNPNVFISSADWMIRNLDHRLEVACPVNNIQLKNELLHLLQAQLKDNVKARVLNSQFHNNYVPSHGKKRFRSQQEIYRILSKK